MRKIVVTGPESTGKTTLCRALAERFGTAWVPEYARQYIDESGRDYVESDLVVIAEGQLQSEIHLAGIANNLLFCDTNLLTIKIWSEYVYGSCAPQILQWHEAQEYDYYLLTNIDLPWVPDPQREHPNSRGDLFQRYYDAVESSGVPFAVISGSGDERTAAAVAAIQGAGLII